MGQSFTASSGSILGTLSEKVSKDHTALLVIDVQNDFCHPDGTFGKAKSDLSMVDGMVRNLGQLIERAREIEIPVIFVQSALDDIYLFPAWRERNIRLNFETPRCISGTWGAEFYELLPSAGDLVVTKHRYSAFVGTNLDILLKSRGIQCVIAAGIATNICVESTARDAFMRNYYVVLGEDASAAYSSDQHASAVTNMKFGFGSVATTAEILKAWDGEPTKT